MAITENFSNEPSTWSPEGRIGRARFFWLILLSTILMLPPLAQIEEGARASSSSSDFLWLFFFPGLYLSIVTGAKRLHDLGHSGWWQVLGLLPVVNLIVGLYMLLRPGNPKPNKYGPPRGQRRVSNGQIEPSLETSSTEALIRAFPVQLAEGPKEAGLAAASASKPLEPAISVSEPEDDLWAHALKEFEGPGRRKGLWARIFSEVGGNESVAQAAYLSARVEQMRRDIQEQKAASAKAVEDSLRRPKAMLNELSRFALLRSKQAKGVCPNCDGLVGLADSRCPHCDASSEVGAAWKPQPAADRVYKGEAAIERLQEAGYEVEKIDGGWQLTREGLVVGYAYSPIDLVALGELAHIKRPLRNWFTGVESQDH